MSRVRSAIKHIKDRWRRSDALETKINELNARLTTLSTAYNELQGQLKQHDNFAPYTPTPDLDPLFTPTPPIETLGTIGPVSLARVTAKRMSTPRAYSDQSQASRSFSF